MSDVALFTIGTLVFFLGAMGLVLFGLDTFRTWSEASTEPDDAHRDAGAGRGAETQGVS